MGADLVQVKVEPEAAAGALALIEYSAAIDNPGPPPHIHHGDLHEFWYVLEGEIDFIAGKETRRATAGTFVHIPPETVHTFRNAGRVRARWIGIFAPGRYLEMLAELGAAFPVAGGPPDERKLTETFRKWRVELVSAGDPPRSR